MESSAEFEVSVLSGTTISEIMTVYSTCCVSDETKMKPLLCCLLLWIPTAVADTSYEPDARHPFGRPNPSAPPELQEFSFIIGQNDCTEQRRKPGSDEWSHTERTWDGHYTMNGFAIFDTGHSSSSANGNMRIYDPVEGVWNVTFFSSPAYSSGVWRGTRVGNSIVLKQAQKARGTDMDGWSRLTFSDITTTGFKWVGEWVSLDEKVVYPFWRISCARRDPDSPRD